MTASALLMSDSMRPGNTCLILITTALVTFASPARADNTSWNPFLFTAFCSTCGPQTPLTLEQVDGFHTLIGGELGPIIPLSPPVGNATPSGGQGNEGKPTLHLLPSAPGLGVSSFSTGGTGHTDSDDRGENQSGRLDYGIDVNEGSNANQNVVTFTSTDGISNNVSSGGGGGQGQTLVPEPTTLLLFGSGLMLVAGQLRKRRRAAR
jgi:hypothetical protein